MSGRRIVLAGAVVALMLLALFGAATSALTFLPAVALLALPLAGRFLAEDRIVRHWRRLRPQPRRRRTQARRPAGHELPLTSALRRSPLRRRGPPAPLAA